MSYRIWNILASILFHLEFAYDGWDSYGADVKPYSRIKNFRISLGMKQGEFADCLETSQSEISKLEKGKPPSTSQLVALARLSGKPVEYFLNDGVPPDDQEEIPAQRRELTTDEIEKAARRVFSAVRQAWHDRDFTEAEIVDLYSRCRRLITDI